MLPILKDAECDASKSLSLKLDLDTDNLYLANLTFAVGTFETVTEYKIAGID